VDRALPAALFQIWNFQELIMLNNIQWILNGGEARSMWPGMYNVETRRLERLRGPAQHFARHLHVDDNFYDANCIKGEFLRSTGLIGESTIPPTNVGGLYDLKASHLMADPFRIALTEKPNEHLTFDDSGTRPTVRLLHLDRIIKIYLSQRSSLAR
jgi:hypothetical protein